MASTRKRLAHSSTTPPGIDTEEGMVPDEVSPKAPVKRQGRPFTTKDPILDDLYHRAGDWLISQQLHKPFHYVHEAGERIMTIGNSIRFRRRDGELAVRVEQQANGLWKDFSSADLPNHAGQCVYSGYSVSPVMWPIGSAQAENVRAFLPGALNSFLSAEIAKIKKERNQSGLVNPQSELDFGKKVQHLTWVLTKKWAKSQRQCFMPQFKTATKLWWSEFVDRPLFTQWVRVYGSSSRTRMSWENYAHFSQMHNPQILAQHLVNLGPARFMLANCPERDWTKKTEASLIPPNWASVWPQIKLQPLSLQQALADIAKKDDWRHPSCPAPKETLSPWDISDNASFGKYPQKIDDNKKTSKAALPQDLSCPVAWSIFQSLVGEHTYKPRELMLLLDASQAVYHLWEPGEHWDERAKMALRVWKQAAPTGMKKFSHDVRNAWSRNFGEMTKSSMDQGDMFSLPIPQYPHPQGWYMTWSKMTLEDATSGYPEQDRPARLATRRRL